MAFGKKKVRELEEFKDDDYADASEEDKVIEIEEEDHIESEEEIQAQPPMEQAEQPREQKPINSGKEEKKEPQKKYALFATAQRVGVVNTETKEVIAEGEAVQLEIQVKILEKLDEVLNLLKE